jgi:hypothetical protein
MRAFNRAAGMEAGGTAAAAVLWRGGAGAKESIDRRRSAKKAGEGDSGEDKN